MQIQFCGAAKEVTGSCHLLITKTKKILVDCGMFQGSNYNEGKNFEPFPFDPAEIDVMVLTHAHLDHVGRIPKLVKEGFSGQIFATGGTVPLTEIVLTDAARIMDWNHTKYQYPILFTQDDVVNAMARFVPVDYDAEIDIGDGIMAIWRNAGHILGSSFIEIRADGQRIVFSGDIGNEDAPILKDTAPLPEHDILVIESTYGDRLHETKDESEHKLLDLITEAANKGGAIMMPAFSIERAQEMLYRLDHFSEHDKTLPKMPVFLDSPMAIKVVDVFKQFPEYYDQEACKQYMNGDDFLDFAGLELTETKEQSKAINRRPNPKLIIAGAGMMNGGRIVHHAHKYLQDPKSTLIIIGYQAQGSLGRRLYEGSERVKVLGDMIDVHATVKAIGGLSAHGDQHKLLSWMKTAPQPPKKVYCVHGEPNAATTLSHKIRDEFGAKSFVPEFGETVDLI